MRKLKLGSPTLLCCFSFAASALWASSGAAQSGAGPGADEPTGDAEEETAPEETAAPEEPSPSDAAAEEPAEPAPSEASVGAAVQFGPSASTASANADAAGPETGSSGEMGGARNYGGPTTGAEDEWKFSFSGYFRAPMRVGIGERNEAKTDQSKTTLSQPQIPDDQYLSWQYTKQNQRSWAETFFGYGNNVAKGTVAIQAFNFTDASFNDQDAQFGISQAWVTITPDMMSIDEDMRLQVRVGSFWNRFGGAGRYDAGAYDTFIFGRTHVMGEDIRMEYDLDETTFFVQEGFGTKEPNPDPNHNTKFTLLGHLHAGFNWDEFIEFGAHILHAWTQEPDHECVSREEEWTVQGANPRTMAPGQSEVLAAAFSEAAVGACKQENPNPDPDDPLSADVGQYARSDSPDGSMTVFGGDVVFNTSGFGRIYAGFSRIVGNHAVTVAPAIEVIHANGGGFFNMGITHQYFLERHDWEPQDIADQEGVGADEFRRVRREYGNGTIDTIAAQWDLSLGTLIGPDVLGQQQLNLQVFGMLNLVKSEDDPQLESITKNKFGAELIYNPLSWFGVATRFDQVNPRSDVPEQSFSAIGPRLIFRSNFATHEEINVGFSHYFFAERECSRDGSDPDFIECVQPPGATVGPAGFYYRPGVTSSKNFRGGPVEPSSPTGPFPDKTWDPPHENTFYISASIWW